MFGWLTSWVQWGRRTYSVSSGFSPRTRNPHWSVCFRQELFARHRIGGKLRALRDVFAVRRLIAIEAKVIDWQDGLQQAFQNVWFASESYLLLPRLPQSSILIEKANHFGVGLRVMGQALDSSELRSRQANIPRSYASWLFNEWVWRAGCTE